MRLAIFLVVAACIGWSFPAFAATFTVNSTVDAVDAVPGDGFCADSGGACTLRAAVMETNVLPGEDSVVLPSGVYVLTSVASGALAVTGELVVAGAGAGQTAIEYVWQVSGVVGPGRLTLRNVTATAPNGIAFSVSGAVLEVIRSRITDAWVGILAHAGSNVLVIDSEISRSAGGIVLLESTGGLVNSTVSEHQPVCRPKDGCSGGQAIYLAGSSLSMVNSSVAENGSAIVGDGVLTLAGTVISHCDPALSVTSYGYNISSDGSCGLTDPTDQPADGRQAGDRHVGETAGIPGGRRDVQPM
jgi:CSLREA domain-containing protein